MVTVATIMRHEAQLRQVSAQIRQANDTINSVKQGVEAAANDLASKWEGEARDAFVAEQLNAKTWLEKMIGIIGEMISTIDKVNAAYSNVDKTVSDLIKSK